jgi:hypothetical protein
MLASILPIFWTFLSVVTWLGPTTHDFGDMTLYEDQTHAFVFRNTTSEPLFIDNVRAGCGCTVPDWTEQAIQPDSTAELRVRFSPRQTGFLRKPIKVYFSGQRQAEKLYVEAFVERN